MTCEKTRRAGLFVLFLKFSVLLYAELHQPGFPILQDF